VQAQIDGCLSDQYSRNSLWYPRRFCFRLKLPVKTCFRLNEGEVELNDKVAFSAITENRAASYTELATLFDSTISQFASLHYPLFSRRFVAAILWRVRLDRGLTHSTLLHDETR